VRNSSNVLLDANASPLGWVESSRGGVPPVRFTPEFVLTEENGEETMNRLNDHLYAQNRTRALDEVLADFRQTHAQVVDELSQLSEEDIFDPKRFAWREGVPLLATIAGNTYGHYQEHLGWIRAGFNSPRS
jgi:hypothetical protein